VQAWGEPYGVVIEDDGVVSINPVLEPEGGNDPFEEESLV